MTANLLLADAMEPGELVRPRCWNRPPRESGRVEHGLNRQTGKVEAVPLSNDWLKDRCATWDGVGIGRPTDDYPTGTPYPIAHRFDCDGCRWKPEGVP